MKNYYEILQVNENASIEIIEKAYKVLVKKYHPDLQKDVRVRDITEEKLKQINEAYDVLSNEFLKEQYDIELKKEKEEQIKKKYGNIDYRTEKTTFYGTSTNNSKKTTTKRQQTNVNYQANNVGNNQEETKPKGRYDNLGTFDGLLDLVKVLYRDRPKREEFKEMTKKDIIAILLTIVVVIGIGIVLWCIPFTNGWIREILFENPLVSWIGKN